MTRIPNELASRFGDADARRQIIQEYGDSPNMFFGENADGEKVIMSVSREKGIVLTTYQKNGWLRINYYDADGFAQDETFDGRWNEVPKEPLL